MRLRRSELGGAGIQRLRRGRGFRYATPDGSPLSPQDEHRIAALVIPPAWTDVWIAPHPGAHIQATGVDAAGRVQYLYHAAWRRRMDRLKFDRALDLADALPAARRGVTTALRSDGLTRERVLAGAFRMLDSAHLRVGSERYALEHGSYGLATLLVRHARVVDDTVELGFPGKSGQHWESDVRDADLARLVGELRARGPRARLLAWRDGTWHPVSAMDINAEVKRRTGGDFTAKDFRTLHGTVAAAVSLARIGPRSTRGAQDRAIAAAIRDAASALGNTPAVARASYVDPRLLDRYRAGAVVDLGRGPEGQLRELLG